MNFIAELKRRNVIRMAGLYLVGAWLLTQVSSTVLPMFDAPAWLPRSIVILLAIGFVPALMFSWVFELTPHGIKRDAEVKPEESIAPQTARRMDRLIIAVLALALVYFGFDKFVLAPRREATQLAQVENSVAQHATQTVSNKSIAVLPFSDLSPGHDQDYFSDGMAEEILNALAQVKDLKVAGRTSSFYFKGKNEDLRTIGKTLGVANILEGSVRKQGDKVRITAQLIQVSDDTHLWSHAYDGDLSDVFQLQENIARAITGQLKAVLQGEQKTRLVPVATDNPEAYSLYLQATAIFNRRDGTKYQDAIADLQQAIKLDPNYARAYSRLASLYVVIPSHSDIDVRAGHAEVLRYARSASALDPSVAEPWAATGFSWGKFAGHFIDQREAFEQALKLDPNDVTTNFWFGLSLAMTGYRERGIALLDHALKLDPMLPNALRWRGIAYFYAGDLDHAEELLKRARDLGLPFADHNLADVIQARGDSATAAKLAAGSASWLYTGMPSDTAAALAYGIHGDVAASKRAVALIEAYLASPHEHIPGLIPVAMARLGEPARALAMERSQQTGDTTDFLMLLWSPQGRALRELPEFPVFLRDFGLVALWDKYGPPDVCRRKAPNDYACD
jgi:TolB-like protein/Tfp pilus assembly protein PilF